MTAFILPDLGEGLKEADLVEWLVKEGQSVQLDELVLLVETAKAVVELPAPSAGTITRLAVSEGKTVKVGQVLFEYEEIQQEDNEQKIAEDKGVKPCLHEQKESVSVVGELGKSDEEKINLYEIEMTLDVQQNGKDSHTKSEEIRTKTSREYNSNSAPVCINAFKESRVHFLKDKTLSSKVSQFSAISPKTMAFAKKLGLQDILEGSFARELTLHDLLTIYQEKTLKQTQKPTNHKEYIPMIGARKVMAQVMTKAHQEIPAATLFEDADITHWPLKTDITLKVINAMIVSCLKNPIMNTWYDSENIALQQHQHIDLGVAMNSERGLFVPVIRQIDLKDENEIRLNINHLREQVKEQSISVKDLTGATITLSNFGSLSGRYATPIIVPPQVCIIGIGKSRDEVIVKNGKIQVGNILPISLSFDHRAATGAEAAQFMQNLIQTLESH